MMMRLALAAALMLAACATAPAPAPDNGPVLPQAAEDTCNARQYATQLGQPASATGVPPAGPHVRHIHPDSAVTMDLSPQRLNVMIDSAGKVYAFRCY